MPVYTPGPEHPAAKLNAALSAALEPLLPEGRWLVEVTRLKRHPETPATFRARLTDGTAKVEMSFPRFDVAIVSAALAREMKPHLDPIAWRARIRRELSEKWNVPEQRLAQLFEHAQTFDFSPDRSVLHRVYPGSREV